jgi:methylmalonyl-CoA/ethylmalonyl-CoA epimerase
VVLDHVALAARRIRDMLPIYRDLLGGVVAAGGDNVPVGYRAVQLRYPHGGTVELLEPLRGSTFLDSFLAERGAGGVHHVTFRVPDIDAAVSAMSALGFTPIGRHRHSPSHAEVFLHPREALGVLVQLIEVGPEHDAFVSAVGSVEAILDGRGVRGNGEPSP